MRRIGRTRALILLLLACGVGVLSYLLGVANPLGQSAEDSVLDAAEFSTDPPAPLSLVAVPTVVLALLALALLAWWAYGAWRAIALLVLGGAAIVASQLLKQQVLVRPGFLEFDAPNTFPSGHMTVFAVVAGALIWAVPARLRVMSAYAGALLMAIAAAQLLEYGWHRPSDVIGAQALALCAFALAAVLRPGTGGRPRRGSGAVGTVSRVCGGILAALGLILVLVGAALAVAGGWFGSDELMLVASEVAVVGASALTARVLLTVSG